MPLFFRVIAIAMYFPFIVGCISQIFLSEKHSGYTGETQNNLRELEKLNIPAKFWSETDRMVGAGEAYLQGEYLASKGDLKGAAEYFSRAYTLDPDPYLGARAVQSKVAAHGYEVSSESLNDAKRLLILYPRNAAVSSLMGNMLLHKGEDKKAKKHFLKSLEIDNQDKLALIQLIRIYQKSKNHQRVIEVSKRLRQVAPEMRLGWTIALSTLLLQKKYVEASRLVDKALLLFAEDYEFVVYGAFIYSKVKNYSRLSQVLNNFYHREDSFLESEIQLRNRYLVSIVGSDKQAVKLMENWNRSLDHLGPAFELQKLFLYWKLKDLVSAHRTVKRVIDDYPNYRDIYYFAAVGRELEGKLEEAIDFYQRISIGSKFYVPGRYRLSKIYREKGDLAKAAQVVTDSLNHPRVGAEFFILAGSVLQELKQFDRAKKVFRNAIDQFPRRTHLLYLLAVAEFQSGSEDHCIKILEKLVKIDSGHAAAHNFLGYLFSEKNIRLEEAENLIKKALQLKPGDPYYTDSLAWVYYRQGRYKEAAVLIEYSIRSLPEQGIVLAHYADIQYALGNIELAKKAFSQAINKTLEAREREQIEARIDELFPEILVPKS